MASARDIRHRIQSIENTAQITKAMHTVAASKMRTAQQAAIDVRPFVRLLYSIQRTAATHAAGYTHPLLQRRDVKTRMVILVASDKGLCGALNSNIFRLAGRYDPRTTVFVTAGRKAAQFVARTRRQLVADFAYGDTPQYAESRAIAALARDQFVKGAVDAVTIIATRFVNTLKLQPVAIRFLPLDDVEEVEIPGMPAPGSFAADPRTYLFEPSAGDVLDFLLDHFLNAFVYVVLLNAKASEQSARMVSMKGATDNAGDMIRGLTLALNKLRQGRITQELLEIAGGQS